MSECVNVKQDVAETIRALTKGKHQPANHFRLVFLRWLEGAPSRRGRAVPPVTIGSGSGWPAAGSTGTWRGSSDSPLWSRGSASTAAPTEKTTMCLYICARYIKPRAFMENKTDKATAGYLLSEGWNSSCTPVHPSKQVFSISIQIPAVKSLSRVCPAVQHASVFTAHTAIFWSVTQTLFLPLKSV